MAIRYVPAAYCVDKKEIDDMLSVLNENDDVPLELIVMIDHAYHAQDSEYDGGLSFFDRLHWKLSLFFELGWTPEELKNQVRGGSTVDYMNLLRSILDKEAIDIYGV
jgi:hypothetical protein